MITKEEFDKLSNKEKRIEIAKDVIDRFTADKLRVGHGVIWSYDLTKEIYFRSRADSYNYGDQRTPQEYINSNTCEVCAKGALVCSWVGSFNNFEWKDMHATGVELDCDKNRFPKELIDIFGREMLDRIEAAFEGIAYSFHYNFLEYIKKAKIAENEERHFIHLKTTFKGDIVSIMQHIVDNNGSFDYVPELR